MNIPYQVEVAVCAEPIMYGKVVQHARLSALQAADGREYVFLPSGQRLHVGLYRGGLPCVRTRDMVAPKLRLDWTEAENADHCQPSRRGA